MANEKGGVAKTTSTLSLRASLVETGSKVLLVDLDAQANLTLALGVDPEKNSKSIGSLLLENTPLSEIVLETGIPGLFLAPSNHELGYIERFLPSKPGHEQLIRNTLRASAQEFDYVIFDCPPFLGAITLSAVVASDLLIIPTQAEYFSIYAIRNMNSLIRRVRAQSNARLMYRILLTMYDRRNRIHRTLYEQLNTTFGNGVLATIIEIDTKLRESPIAGMPIIYHSPKSRSAMQYRALAQEIKQYAQETNNQSA